MEDEIKKVSLADVKDAEERTEKAGAFMKHTQTMRLPEPIVCRAITEYNLAVDEEKETKKKYRDPEFNKTPGFIKNLLVKDDK